MACKYKSRVWDNGWCNVACMYCTLTQEMNCKHNKRTNADRIRAMSDEELADMLWKTGRNYRAVCADPSVDYNEHRDHLIAWLKQPAEEVGKWGN